MKLPAYPRTKPSGVEWLGEVPEHWEILRFRNIVVGGVTNGLFKTQDAFGDGTRLINVYDAYRGDFNVDEQSLERVATTAAELRLYRVRCGDIFFVRSSLKLEGVGRAVCCLNQTEDLVFECHLVRARPNLRRVDPRFLILYLNSTFVVHSLIAAAKTTTMATISQPKMLDLPTLLPALPEQRAIAAFLDRETERMDRLVTKKRELIERLKEKRTALISRTVTRGLPPAAARAVGLPENPPLKPTGIEWLGDIPKHWEARRLKDVGTLKGGAGFPHEEQGLEDEELPFYKVGDLKASLDGRVMTKPEHTISKETARKLRAAIIPPESIVFAKIGAALLLNRRRVTFVDCCIDNNMTAYLPDKRRIRSEWAFYWLSILDFGEFMNPGAVPSFSEGYQAILPVLLPPLQEQTAIAAYLDEETAKLDALVAKVEEAIERLQEYRTALITAAVTGKIDVRGDNRL